MDVCYLGPILDILLRRWFPLVEVSPPTTTILEEHVLPTFLEQHVTQEEENLPKQATKE